MYVYYTQIINYLKKCNILEKYEGKLGICNYTSKIKWKDSPFAERLGLEPFCPYNVAIFVCL